MNIDIYSTTGAKKGTLALPTELFGVEVNEGLIHQAIVRQQSNRRTPIAHAKNRSEVSGSTRKLFQQKGTGRARRGSLRSPLLRGGGKAFGPRNNANFEKDMPRKMRHKALACSLSLQAKAGIIFGLENYSAEHKTSALVDLLKKLPVELGRNITIVVPAKHEALQLAARNVPRVKVLTVDYLNPEDIVGSRHLIFVSDAVARAVEMFATKTPKKVVASVESETSVKKTTAKKPAAKKAVKTSSSSKKS